MDTYNKLRLAYIIGVALGDGNLSAPNTRATRLRITCDSKYPNMATEIVDSLTALFPQNKVSLVSGPTDTYFNISVYSNKLNEYLPWRVGNGSKFHQNATVPEWILKSRTYSKHCLKGLLQTDGSIYHDRGYTMVNFTNTTEALSDNVYTMISSLGYAPHKYRTLQKTGNYKYTIRLSKNVSDFIQEIALYKS